MEGLAKSLLMLGIQIMKLSLKRLARDRRESESVDSGGTPERPVTAASTALSRQCLVLLGSLQPSCFSGLCSRPAPTLQYHGKCW